MTFLTRTTLCLIMAATLFSLPACAADPLPSWNEGATKASITEFVAAITTAGSADFVPEAERIAVFDNDGCLWAEQPAYFQLFFAIDRAKEMGVEVPELDSEEAILGLIGKTHAGMTTDEFAAQVEAWITTAKHPTTGKLYTEMIYQPMRELLDYLRAHGFKTYIVSGGGVEFMRVFCESAYGIPPEQVLGSTIKTRFELRDGVPVIVRLPELDYLDDKEGKPLNINRTLGRRPLAAFGNSDGDLAMLQWTAGGTGKRFCLYVHHTDADREWAYDRESHIGRLDRGLDEAAARGWTVVDMKTDWARIFPGD